jgi:hypothetical protein
MTIFDKIAEEEENLNHDLELLDEAVEQAE